jgi:hypothetical protein
MSMAKAFQKAAVAAVRYLVLPDNAPTTKGKDERCLLLIVLNVDPQHLFRPGPSHLRLLAGRLRSRLPTLGDGESKSEGQSRHAA